MKRLLGLQSGSAASLPVGFCHRPELIALKEMRLKRSVFQGAAVPETVHTGRLRLMSLLCTAETV